MKQEETSWSTDSGIKGKAQSLIKKQPASNNAGTSPPLYTPSMAWQPRRHKQPSNTLPSCLQRSGVELTLTW
ncbi:hypothetical protein ACHAW6_002198 [Cyclotella cf. meneghiniana]